MVYGEDNVSKAYVTAKTILLSSLIYVGIVLAIYFGIKSFINIESLAQVLV